MMLVNLQVKPETVMIRFTGKSLQPHQERIIDWVFWSSIIAIFNKLFRIWGVKKQVTKRNWSIFSIQWHSRDLMFTSQFITMSLTCSYSLVSKKLLTLFLCSRHIFVPHFPPSLTCLRRFYIFPPLNFDLGSQVWLIVIDINSWFKLNN